VQCELLGKLRVATASVLDSKGKQFAERGFSIYTWVDHRFNSTILFWVDGRSSQRIEVPDMQRRLPNKFNQKPCRQLFLNQF
jgi:hypothetical protein